MIWGAKKKNKENKAFLNTIYLQSIIGLQTCKMIVTRAVKTEAPVPCNLGSQQSIEMATQQK